MVRSALEAYANRLLAAGWDADRRAPGLEREAVEAALIEAGMTVIEPIIELYEFADGAGRGELFEITFLSLAAALAARTEALELVESEDPEPPFLPCYLPVVEHDPTLVVDTSDPDGRVLEIWWDTPLVEAHASLAAFIQAESERLTSGEVNCVDGLARRVPTGPATAMRQPPAKPVAAVSYLAGSAKPTGATLRIAAMLPDVFAASGATRFRVESRPKGGLAGNNDLELDQVANFRSLVEQADGIAAYTIRWELTPPEPPRVGPRLQIRVFVDTEPDDSVDA